MGQRISRRSESGVKSPSSKSDVNLARTKYPLPLETFMLKKIKKQYQNATWTMGDAENNSSNNGLTGNSNDDAEQLAPFAELVLDEICESKKRKQADLMKPMQNCGGDSPYEITECYEHPRLINRELKFEQCSNVLPGDQEDCFNFIDLPILVVENLLQHLSPSAILTLRATCHKTKSWIDDHDYVLTDFNLRIEPETCECNSPPETGNWRNFSIPYVSIQSTFVQDTLDRYCDIIHSLEIYAPKTFAHSLVTNYPCQDHRRLFEMIHRCRNVQCVSLCRLDSLTEIGDDSFTTLRVLSIDRIQWMKHSDFHLFESLIMRCPHLEYLKIPEFEILGSLAFIFYDAQTQPEVQHMVLPLMTYLDRYRSASISSTSKKLYIDVVEFEDFKLCSSEAFYNLSRKCVECNAVLMNVYFVPRDAVLRNQQDIVESFASMFGFIKIDFHAELWQNLEVMECWIEDFPEDVELTMRQLSFLKTIPKIPNLKSLTIRLSVDDPCICSAALDACVGQTYRGIEKLILRRHLAMPERFVKIPSGFGNAFCNLKHLYLQELDSKNEDFQRLWPSLQVLEELFVYKCPYLTQEAFLGHNCGSTKNCAYQPAVLKMPRLQVLVVFLYDGVSGFDDLFLKNALRLMRLRGFALRGIAGVEFTESGMLSLLNSPFHDTIEDFEAPSSLFRPSLSSNYWNFYVALPKKELRQNRIWLSCSVLLNSLSSRKHVYNFKRKSLRI